MKTRQLETLLELLCGDVHVVGSCCVATSMLWAAAVWRRPCCGQLLCGDVHVVGSCCVATSMLWAAAVWRRPCCGQLLCGDVHVVGSCCVATSMLWAAAVWRRPCCGQLKAFRYHQQQHTKTMSTKTKIDGIGRAGGVDGVVDGRGVTSGATSLDLHG
nr:uncharacterized protein LOC128702156 [Cherax quadricarinatus]